MWLAVLYTRMIAELVGGEAVRNASSYPIMGLVAIYKEEGLAGLFGYDHPATATAACTHTHTHTHTAVASGGRAPTTKLPPALF